MTNIAAEEALKTKRNFEEFLEDYNNPLVTSTLAEYTNGTTTVVAKICDLTQKMETLTELLNDPEIENLTKPPFITWYVTSEKPEIVKALDIFNKFSKGIKIFVFKACLNVDKIDINCILKPQKSPAFSGGKSKELQLEYWKKYSEICDELSEGDFQVIPKPQHWQYIPLGKTGVSLQLTVNTQTDSIGVDLFIANNKSLFEKLEKNKTEIENELGTLEWINNSSVKSARIRQMKNCIIQELNPESITQHIELAKAFKETFKKYLTKGV